MHFLLPSRQIQIRLFTPDNCHLFPPFLQLILLHIKQPIGEIWSELLNSIKYLINWGTLSNIWWRQCASHRKVAVSMPDSFTGTSHWHNLSSCTVTLESIQRVTENEYQGYVRSGGKGGQWVGLTILPPSCVDCFEIWDPQPQGSVKDCAGIALPFT